MNRGRSNRGNFRGRGGFNSGGSGRGRGNNNNMGRQRQQQMSNPGAGILGDGPLRQQGMGRGNITQFKKPSPLSPPAGRMQQNMGGGMMQNQQNQMLGGNQGNQFVGGNQGNQFLAGNQGNQMLNQGNQMLNQGNQMLGQGKGLLGGPGGQGNQMMGGDMLSGNLGNQFSSGGNQGGSVVTSRESQLQMMNNLLVKQQQQINAGKASLLANAASMDDVSLMGNRSNNLGDVGMGGGNRNQFSNDFSINTSRASGGLNQNMNRNFMDNNRGNRIQQSFDDVDIGSGRSSLLSDNMGQSSFMGGRSSLGQDISRSSLLDDLTRNTGTSSAGILDASNPMLANMDEAIFGSSNQMQSNSSNQLGMMGNQGNTMQGMRNQGNNMQGMRNQANNMQGVMRSQANNMQGMMGNQGINVQGMRQQQTGNMAGQMVQQRQNQNQGLLGSGSGGPGGMAGGPGGMAGGLLGQRPQGGPGKPGIPSLMNMRGNQRTGGMLGKRPGRGGRDLGGEKRFRRNSGPSPQGNRRIGNRFDRSSDGRGRGRDRRTDRPKRSSSRDRRPHRDSGSSRSHDSDRKSHNNERRSHDRSKSHDKSADKKDEKKTPVKNEEGAKEEYDPAEPTEDDETEEPTPAWIEKKNDDVEMIDLTAASPSKDKKEETKSEDLPEKTLTVTIDSKGRSVDESALVKKEAQETKDKGKPVEDKKKFYCHACMVDCRDFEGFARHMKGKKHASRMASLNNATQQALEQQAGRAKAEDHLRNVERKPRSDDRRRRDSPPRRGSNDRRFGGRGRFQAPMQPPRSFFRSPISQSDRERERRRRRDRDHDETSNASFPGDLGDMVTVDEIGFEDQDDASMDSDGKTSESKGKSGSEKQEKKVPQPEDADDYVIPDFDPKNAVGVNYVVPVSGYFCKLCHKFYTTEVAAKTTHCQSKQHYDKFNAVMMNKLMTKALSKNEDEEIEKPMEKQEEEKKKEEVTKSKPAAATSTPKSAPSTPKPATPNTTPKPATPNTTPKPATSASTPEVPASSQKKEEQSSKVVETKKDEKSKQDKTVPEATINGKVDDKKDTEVVQENTAEDVEMETENTEQNTSVSSENSTEVESVMQPPPPPTEAEQSATNKSKAIRKVAQKARRGRK